MTVTGRPLLDDAGQIRGGVVVFHDTTERRMTLDQLAHAETKYRALVEQLPVCRTSAASIRSAPSIT
jgi:hypothetical protein